MYSYRLRTGTQSLPDPESSSGGQSDRLSVRVGTGIGGGHAIRLRRMFVPSAPNSGHSLVLEISESYRAILQNFIWALGWACEGRMLQVSSESALFYNMSMRPFEGDFNEKQLVSH